MDPSTAGSSGSYTVLVSTTAKGKIKKTIRVNARYNASNQSVVLTFSRQKFHIQVSVTGVRAANGASMSSVFTRKVK